jgi:cyclopropane fatty-acyl-phospholipid synthase-like methyltransferase
LPRRDGAGQGGTLAAVHLRDYREERGRYDAVVSVGMVEAVGGEYWPAYFSAVDRSDETFRRMWEFYLACSEAGCRVGYPGVRRFAMVR